MDAQLVGRAGHHRAARPHRLRGARWEHRPGVDERADLVQARTRSVTTPKLPPPPRSAQNRSAFSSSLARHRSAARGHDLGRDEAVDRSPCSRSGSHAAAEREAGDASVRDRPAGTARPCSCVARSRSPSSAPPPRRAGRGVHATPRRMPGEVDDDAVVDGDSPPTLCPPPRTASGRPSSRAAVDRGDDVVGVVAAQHRGGTAVDRAVPHPPGSLVVTVAGLDDLAGEAAGPEPAPQVCRKRLDLHLVSVGRGTSIDRSGRPFVGGIPYSEPGSATRRSTSAGPSRAIRERGTTRSKPAASARRLVSASTCE